MRDESTFKNSRLALYSTPRSPSAECYVLVPIVSFLGVEMSDTTTLVRVLPPARHVLVCVKPSEVRGCFEKEADVTVLDRWPRSNEPRRWFIAKAMPGNELRLRIAPPSAHRRSLGNVRRAIEVELRVTAIADGDGSSVEARYALSPTALFFAAIFVPGLSILLMGWLIAGWLGVPAAIGTWLAVVWPRNLREDTKELQNKLSAALGPVLAGQDPQKLYR